MNHLFTLFSDFNCPFCYALHERLHGLQLLDRCAWKGVQHAPHLPIPMRPWHGALHAELLHEVSVVHRLSPDLALQAPPGKPNTASAIACAAGLLEQDRKAGMTLVWKMYQAFWVEGQDISDKEVLEALAGNDDKADDNGKRIAQRWDTEWHATEQAGVPLVVAPSGDLSIGCVPVGEIQKFFADHT
jgi:hypothetical protein